MKCWHCLEDLMWSSDCNYEDYNLKGEGVVSFLDCSNCEASVVVYLPGKNTDDKFLK